MENSRHRRIADCRYLSLRFPALPSIATSSRVTGWLDECQGGVAAPACRRTVCFVGRTAHFELLPGLTGL